MIVGVLTPFRQVHQGHTHWRVPWQWMLSSCCQALSLCQQCSNPETCSSPNISDTWHQFATNSPGFTTHISQGKTEQKPSQEALCSGSWQHLVSLWHLRMLYVLLTFWCFVDVICLCDMLVFCERYVFLTFWCLVDVIYLSNMSVFCGCYMSFWHFGVLWILYVLLTFWCFVDLSFWHLGVLWMLHVFLTLWYFVDVLCLSAVWTGTKYIFSQGH